MDRKRQKLTTEKILFEDSDIEIRDSDDDLLAECSQIFLENQMSLPFHLGSEYENRPSTSYDYADNMYYVSSDDVTQSNDEALNIDSMPNEMLIKIFGYLSHNVLGRIARNTYLNLRNPLISEDKKSLSQLVCRRWNELTKIPVLWRKVNVEFNWSHSSQNTVAEYFVNKLPSCVSHLRLHFEYHCDWTESLDFEKLSKRLKERCPHLKMLILDSVKSLNSLSLVIDLCTMFLENVKTLAIRYSKFPDCPEKEECHRISKIEVLDILCCEFGRYNKPPFSRMPYLKQLHIRHMSAKYIDDSWFEDDTSFLNQLHVLDLLNTDISPRIFQAIQNHGLNLKEIYLCWSRLEYYFLNFSNTVFPHLQTICFTGCKEVTSKNVISLIRSCHFLQNIYVDDKVAESYAAHPFVAANSCKLQIVKAGQGVACHATRDYFFDLCW